MRVRSIFASDKQSQPWNSNRPDGWNYPIVSL